MNEKIACIILAAGKGERMRSEVPKVLHPLCGRPMLGYVLDLVKSLKIKKSAVVLGYKHKEVRKFIPAGMKIIIQRQLKGTADAMRVAMPALKNFRGTILVLYGDIPLLKKETIKNLLTRHIENKGAATILTAKIDKPAGYGRILRDKYAAISGIIEEKDANDYQKQIQEINTGIICFDKDRLNEALRYVRADNRKKEYYLTETIGILYRKDYFVDAVKITDVNEALGINSRKDLAKANSIMQQRINEELMAKGVTIISPETAFISFGVKIGPETTIYPFTVIENNVKIGKRCSIGPFVHLRGGTHLGDEIIAGNFLEVVRSKISSRTLIKHFGYIGDSRIGRQVNIGAGTVTANFDGKKKNTTLINDGAFIGSDTVLVAPVKIGKAATTGAGCVVLKHKNVPAGGVVVGVPARAIKKA